MLGSQGMLGHEIIRTLRDEGFDVRGTVRGSQTSQGILHFNFDGTYKSVSEFFALLKDVSVVVNCIGLIPQKQTLTNQYRDYISYNALLPSFLDRSANKFGFKVIQIATDCVFSGKDGMYLETSKHDADDIYGVTKSMGEIESPNYLNLRCSIIGKELSSSVSLHDWLLSQRTGATVNGYVDHLWNGLTTSAFAKIVSGVLRRKQFTSGTKHIIPQNSMSKYELLKVIAETYGRNDLKIIEHDSDFAMDRRLQTEDIEYNLRLWNDAGFHRPPTIQEMIKEYKKSGIGVKGE